MIKKTLSEKSAKTTPDDRPLEAPTLPSQAPAGVSFGERYRVDRELGHGGMGRVYAARDLKLGRDVAIKILSAAHDPDQLARFEQEARAAGSLQHPNIVAVFDIAAGEQGPYIVSEMLQGSTLRARLEGRPLPLGKALDWATQLAQGLAAAHDKGVVHRDLKPENLFVTHEGRLKVLDFGIAKLQHKQEGEPRLSTQSGVVMGTPGYMSPEQVRGEHADARSDLFSFGTILHEMLSGKDPFQREWGAEVSHAILAEEPPELPDSVPPEVERIVGRCLEKRPEDRFQSARDLLVELAGLGTGARRTTPFVRRRRRVQAAALLAAGLTLVLAAFIAGRRTAEPPRITYRQLTFQRGLLHKARFAPGGRSIVYDAAWNGAPLSVFLMQGGSPESRPLDLPAKARFQSISPAGELALVYPRSGSSYLGRAPLGGGAPRDLEEEAGDADWSPDGTELSALDKNGRLEFPLGHLLLQRTGYLFAPRISPSGDGIAVGHADGVLAEILFVDRAGAARTLTAGWRDIHGIAWASADEVWFGGSRTTDVSRELWAVDRRGRTRLLAEWPTEVFLQDVARDGSALIEQTVSTELLLALAPGEQKERNLSWFQNAAVCDMTGDGRTVFFVEHSAAAPLALFMRATDGTPPVRLGTSAAGCQVSRDGKWVAAERTPNELEIVPTGAGASRTVGLGEIRVHAFSWFPDGARLFVVGAEPEHPARAWSVPIPGGKPVPLTPEGVVGQLSPDGTRIASRSGDGEIRISALEGPSRDAPGKGHGEMRGEPRAKGWRGPRATAEILQWSDDGRQLFLYYPLSPARWRIARLDPATGQEYAWKEFGTDDPGGFGVRSVVIRQDGNAYAYSYTVVLSTLYLVSGLR